MPRLYIEDDAGNVRIVPMEADEVSIGRAEDNGIVLPDRNVSRHHARLRAVNGRFYVEDAGARYGLFLNGTRVDGRREVRPGDLIGLGDYKVKVLPGEGEAEPVGEEESGKGTIPEIPVMADQPAEAGTGETSADTSLISLRDMERVARQGWPSDFEPRDEVARRKSLSRRLIILAVLVAVAALLVAAYVWVSQPTEIDSSAPGPARVAESSPMPAEPAVPPPATTTVETPREPPRSPLERPVKEVPEPTVSPPTKPVTAPPTPPTQTPPRPRETKETPRMVAVVEPRAPRPATTAPASPQKPAQPEGDDEMAAIEAALQAGRLGEAEDLLARCRTAACAKPWKKLGDRYKAGGQATKAIAAFEKARSLTRDANMKTLLERIITSMKEGL